MYVRGVTRAASGSGAALLCVGMAKRRREMDQPCEYLGAGGEWPDGPFKQDAPVELQFYAGVAKRLIDACAAAKADEGKEIADIASDAQLGVATVYNILQGRSWCELLTIHRLEKALNRRLWHHDHIEEPH